MKNFTKLSALTSLLVAGSVFAAQRTVLVEEGTSSTCGPCAANNPTIQQALSNLGDNVAVQIAYHAWWPAPGNDPMYLLNTTEAQNRIQTYYAINGIPDLITDGTNLPDQPWSVNSLSTFWTTEAAVTTPVIISNTSFGIDLATGGMSVTGTVELEAGGSVPTSLKVRMAIIERVITYTTPPGTNGETVFTNVFRKFVTGTSGTTVNLNNSAHTINQVVAPADVNPAWNVPELAVVYFVQDDATKQVYQAKIQNISGLPEYNFTTNSNLFELLPWQQPATPFSVTLTNTSGATDIYNLEMLQTAPTGWQNAFVIDGTPYTAPTQVTLTNGQSKTITISINPTGTGGSAEFKLKVAPQSFLAYTKQHEFSVISGASVLVVDDDAGSTYENQIVSAIPSTIAAGTIRSGATLIDYGLMANFQAVIWFTGDDYGSAITAEDIINIEAYLDNGGKLLLIGQDIGYNINTNGIAGGTAFLNNYLGVNYVYDDANVNSVSGISGNPISDGFNGMLLSGGTGAGNNNYPDVLSIYPLAQSVTTTIFTYVGGTYTGQTAAVAKTGNNNSKVVYFGFPFEAISSNYNRELLMNNILGWLGIQPLISLSATNLYYQNVPLVGGQASASQTLTISNIGGGTLDITSLNITGTGASNFSISNVTAPFSLTAGQSQNIIVDFSATAAGSKSATLAIANSLTTPKNIALFATVVTGIEDQNNVPLEYSISQNYPNPFNPETKINYTLKESGNVKITVYNALGQIVKTLVNENKSVGTRHEIVWNGTDDKGNLVSSGTYFYKIEAGSFSEIKKMLFLK